jgi:hypothetical protein
MVVGALLPMEQVRHQDDEEDRSSIHVQTTTTPTPQQDPIAQDDPIIQEQEQDPPQAHVEENEEEDDAPQQVQGEDDDIPPHISEPYVEDVDDGNEVEPHETLTSIMPRVARCMDIDQILIGLSEGRATHDKLFHSLLTCF